MTESLTIERVQTLRRLTRALADDLRDQLKSYLATLGPLFRPRRVLGEYMVGGEKEPVKGAARVFQELQAQFETVARGKPFTLAREVQSPIEISRVSLELHPVEYTHEARTRGETRSVTIRSPLAWTLSYSGYGPGMLPELLAARTRSSDELYDWLLHQLVLHAVIAAQPGVNDVMRALHFQVAAVTEPWAGKLPLVRISSPLTTMRPPDEVILQSVELSGMDAFEEVVNVEDIVRISEPLKERLLGVARNHGELRAVV
jgi:hypothetical protein